MASLSSDILKPFQRDFLKAFFERDTSFFLTGGTALGAFYLHHRYSEDLDLFTLDELTFQTAAEALAAAAAEIGAKMEDVRTSPYFRRVLLTRARGGESCLVDCVKEVAEQVVSEKPVLQGIRVDAIEDICANKLCTLIGRAEIKDYIDIFFLEKAGYRILDFLPSAQLKDGGVCKETLAYVLSQARLRRIPEYVLLPLSPEELQRHFSEMATRLAVESFPKSGSSK